MPDAVQADLRSLMTRLPGCSGLPPAQLDALAAAAQVTELEPRALLLAEGAPAPDWYGIIESGAVQVSRIALEGNEILDYLTAGDVLDPGAAGSRAPWSATAMEPARCWLVPRAAVAAQRRWLAAQPLTAARGEVALLVSRVGDIVKRPLVSCPGSTPVSGAARLMSQHRVSSIVVLRDDGSAAGIVTDRDLRNKVLAADASAGVPVAGIMSFPLVTLGSDASAFDALLEMTRRNIHHLGVEEQGRLLGVVSSQDLLWRQGAHPVALAREIDAQTSLHALTRAAAGVQSVIQWLADSGARVFDIGRIAAELNDRVVKRTVALVEIALERDGYGPPPATYSWLAAGSEGRREQTFKTDQDNGLVYGDPASEIRTRAEHYFGRLAERVGSALVDLGFPRCDGGFMASTPRWCQPASTWRGYFESWMTSPQPERILAACIYFDLRPVAGSPAPGQDLWDWVCHHAPSARLFLGYLARAAVERQPPLGFFGSIVVERSGVRKGTFDIKARGIFPMTQAMRVYALSHGVRETNTVGRLAQVGDRGAFTPAEVRDLADAYEVLCRVRLTHQLQCLADGRPPDNFINPEALSKADRLLLKEAFRTLGWLQRVLEDRFQTAMIP
jgi:CBS domain-containing protein